MHILISLQVWDFLSNISYLIFDSYEMKVEYLMAPDKMLVHPNSYFLMTIFIKTQLSERKIQKEKTKSQKFYYYIAFLVYY